MEGITAVLDAIVEELLQVSLACPAREHGSLFMLTLRASMDMLGLRLLTWVTVAMAASRGLRFHLVVDEENAVTRRGIRRTLFGIDHIDDLHVESDVGVEVLWVAGIL